MTDTEKEISKLIMNLESDTFTITSLHKLYLNNHTDLSANDKSSRQLVYRYVSKMELDGKLERVPGMAGKAVHYQMLNGDKPPLPAISRDFCDSLRKNIKFIRWSFCKSLVSLS